MMPLRPLVLVGLPMTSTAPYSEPERVPRSIRIGIVRRAPRLMMNERDDARTYRDSVVRVSTITLPKSSWRHGRTVIVTRSVSLVVLLTVSEPTVPRLAVCSRAAGVTEMPPAACAVAAEPKTPAQATTIGTARRRDFTDTIREPSTNSLTPDRTTGPLHGRSSSAQRV